MPSAGRLVAGRCAARVAAAALTVAGLAVGCGSHGPRSGQPAARPLSGIDWSRFSYPVDCFSANGRPQPVRVSDYGATGPDGFFRVVVTPPTFGDVTGDGVADAVVSYRCVGATAGPDTVLVYVATAAGPHLAARLLHGADEYVTSVRPTGKGLVLLARGYTPGTPRCCPDLLVRHTYTWQGGHLTETDRDTEPAHGHENASLES